MYLRSIKDLYVCSEVIQSCNSAENITCAHLTLQKAIDYAPKIKGEFVLQGILHSFIVLCQSMIVLIIML